MATTSDMSPVCAYATAFAEASPKQAAAADMVATAPVAAAAAAAPGDVDVPEDVVRCAETVPFRAVLVKGSGATAAPGEKVLHFIRHGEGQHNVAYATTGDREEYKNWAWEDSRLTAKGEDQARALRPVMEKERVDVVIVSTLSRAILTGMLACGTAQPIVATELVRERIGTHPCDKRRSKSALAADFPVLDLSGVGEEVDPLWTPDREPWDALIGRAHEFLRFVMARPEQHVVCVAHNDFFQALFRDSGWVAGDDVRSILFKNCDKHTVLLRHLDENPGK